MDSWFQNPNIGRYVDSWRGDFEDRVDRRYETTLVEQPDYIK